MVTSWPVTGDRSAVTTELRPSTFHDCRPFMDRIGVDGFRDRLARGQADVRECNEALRQASVCTLVIPQELIESFSLGTHLPAMSGTVRSP